MPILSTKSIIPENIQQGYDRLALRCSLNVQANAGVPSGGSLSVVGTRYRKPAPGEFDICGLVGHGEVGANVEFGGPDTDLLVTLASLTADYVGVNEWTTCSLNFAWRVENGDLVGMAQAMCDEKSKAAGDTNELAATDPEFAKAFGQVLAALHQFGVKQGW